LNTLQSEVIALAERTVREWYALPDLQIGPIEIEELRRGLWRCTVSLCRQQATQRVVIFR